jgi:hypothetical protein
MSSYTPVRTLRKLQQVASTMAVKGIKTVKFEGDMVSLLNDPTRLRIALSLAKSLAKLEMVQRWRDTNALTVKKQ